VPSAPTASDVLATSLKLHWTAPASDGGTPIIGYHVERRSKTSMHWVFLNREPVVGTSLDVRDLFEDTTYEFRVTAVNKMGAGKPSEPSKPITARNPWSKCHATYLRTTADMINGLKTISGFDWWI
jgi:titin